MPPSSGGRSRIARSLVCARLSGVLNQVVLQVLGIIAAAVTGGALTRWITTRGKVQSKQLDHATKKVEVEGNVEIKRLEVHADRMELADRLLDLIEKLERDAETSRKGNEDCEERNRRLETKLDETTRRLRSRMANVEDSEERLRHRLRTQIEGWEDTGKHSVPSMPAVDPNRVDVVRPRPTPQGAHVVGTVRRDPKKPTR